MIDNEANPSSSSTRLEPWYKGKLIGAKPPLRASHLWSIRTKLQLEGRTRDLAVQPRHRQQIARMRCRRGARRRRGSQWLH
jgi:hypothetical protein